MICLSGNQPRHTIHSFLHFISFSVSVSFFFISPPIGYPKPTFSFLKKPVRNPFFLISFGFQFNKISEESLLLSQRKQKKESYDSPLFTDNLGFLGKSWGEIKEELSLSLFFCENWGKMATNIGMMDSAYFVGRNEILTWINNRLQLNLSRVEEVFCLFIAL